MDVKINTLGFTLTHSTGTCEIALMFFADKPQVYVMREHEKKGFLTGNGDLDVVIKTGKVITSKGKPIVLLAIEQEFVVEYEPVFQALEKIDINKLRTHILEGG